MKISIVIPCHIRHLRYLKNMIRGNISHQTKKPDEVIIVINPVMTSYQYKVINNIFDKLKKDYNFVKFIAVKEKCTPGKARNVGFHHSSGDIIIFTDADDLYHSMRNEIITRIFEDHNCDAVIHDGHHHDKGFLTDKKIDYNSIKIDSCVIDPNHEFNMKIENNDFGLVFGHASVKKEVLEKIKYSESLVPSEDSEYFRRVKLNNKKIVCIDTKLSSWFPSNGWATQNYC